MLHLTDDAVTMIGALLEHDGPDAGLRIAQRDDHVALAMSVAARPEPEDTVLLERDVRVFLAPMAGVRLQGSVLDARTGENGRAFFLR